MTPLRLYISISLFQVAWQPVVARLSKTEMFLIARLNDCCNESHSEKYLDMDALMRHQGDSCHYNWWHGKSVHDLTRALDQLSVRQRTGSKKIQNSKLRIKDSSFRGVLNKRCLGELRKPFGWSRNISNMYRIVCGEIVICMSGIFLNIHK